MSKDPWWDDAACKDADSADFDLDGHGAAALLSEKRAKLVCAECPVRAACREDAMAHEAASGNNFRWGVFGGLNPAERANLADKRAEVVA